MKRPIPTDPLLDALVRRGWDTTAPVEVRRCCANYDGRYGCLIQAKCEPEKCEYYRNVVVKVAAMEGVLGRDKAAQVGAVVRHCPDCHKTPLKARQRVCPACRRKRRRASYRKARSP